MYAHSVRRPDGYALITDPSVPGGRQEADTVQCGHCSAIVHVGEIATGEARPGGCYQCGAHLCGVCVTAGVCRPFELWLDLKENTRIRGRWAESFRDFQQRVARL